jgi:hypothetical protein
LQLFLAQNKLDSASIAQYNEKNLIVQFYYSYYTEHTMQWEQGIQDRFAKMIAKIPVFHRGITQEAVTKRAQELAKARSAALVEEVDVIGAFFTEVPSPFYSMMIRLLEQNGFDYKKYGFPKNGGRCQ